MLAEVAAANELTTSALGHVRRLAEVVAGDTIVGSDALLRLRRCGLERRRSRRDGASAKGGVGERRDMLPLFSEDSSEDGACVVVAAFDCCDC